MRSTWLRAWVDHGGAGGLLAAQAKKDVGNLERATGRDLAEPAAVESAQHAAYRNTFLVSGMRNRQFVTYVTKLSPAPPQARMITAPWSAGSATLRALRSCAHSNICLNI